MSIVTSNDDCCCNIFSNKWLSLSPRVNVFLCFPPQRNEKKSKRHKDARNGIKENAITEMSMSMSINNRMYNLRRKEKRVTLLTVSG